MDITILDFNLFFMNFIYTVSDKMNKILTVLIFD